MKGIIFKYDANPSRWSDLRDGADNGCGLEDPDFSTNGFPVWAICGPYARKGVKPGDTLFFVPKMKGLREAGLGDRGYFCTGILCVAEIVGDEQTLQRDNRFSEAYKRKYTSSLKDSSHGRQGENQGHQALRDRRWGSGKLEMVRPRRLLKGPRIQGGWFDS